MNKPFYPGQPDYFDKLNGMDADVAAVRNSYYGALPAAPTTRPDGTPMQPGDRYFDTVAEAELTWDGARWFGADIAAQIQAIQVGQDAGVVGYDTLASLSADLSHRDRAVAYVTNDPIINNNTTYRKLGAPGSGSWVVADKTLADLQLEIVSKKIGSFDVTAAFTPVVINEKGNVPLWLEGSNLGALGVTDNLRAAITGGALAIANRADRKVLAVNTKTLFPLAVTEGGQIPIWLTADGKFDASGIGPTAKRKIGVAEIGTYPGFIPLVITDKNDVPVWLNDEGELGFLPSADTIARMADRIGTTSGFKIDAPSMREIVPVVGEPEYIQLKQAGKLRADATPVVYFSEQPEATPYKHRLAVQCPGFAVVGSRLWAGFTANNVIAGEGVDDYNVLKYSDDFGGTWNECFYWVQNNNVCRLSTPKFYYESQKNILWVFSGTNSPGGFDPNLGTWAISIKNAAAGLPLVSTQWEALHAGYPNCIFNYDERVFLVGGNGEDTRSPPGQMGSQIYELDTTRRKLTKVGHLPKIGSASVVWPETSITQLRDGKLIAIFRTTGGQYVCYSNGSLMEWTKPISFTSVIGVNPASRACIRVSPNSGYVYLAYNNASGRTNMTLARLSKDGKTVLSKVVLEPRTESNASYPDIDFDSAGNILVIWDYNRNKPTAPLEVNIGVVNESDFIQNGNSTLVTKKIVTSEN